MIYWVHAPALPRSRGGNTLAHRCGHNREPGFVGEEDYLAYLHWLGEALKVLHAYELKTSPLLAPHAAYLALGAADNAPRMAYRGLDTMSMRRPSATHGSRRTNQPLANEHFHAKIERMPGERREARLRGRPRLEGDVAGEAIEWYG